MSIFSVEEDVLPKPVYEYITTEEDAHRAMAEIMRHKVVEVDTETTGLDPHSSKIVLAQVGIPGKSYVFDARHDLEFSSVHLDVLKPLLTDKKILKILQNAVFDMKVVKHNYGFYMENIYDTMLVEQLFNLGISARGSSLADLVRKYLGLSMNKEPRGTFENYYQKFEPYQLEYAAGDVAVLSLLRDLQMPRIKKEKFENVARLEFEFTKAMCEMELNGITLDVDKWRVMMDDSQAEFDKEGEFLQKLFATNYGQNVMFGVPIINVDSPKQLLKALRDQGINIDSTSAKSLDKFKGVEVIDALLSYRKLSKLISTYGETLIEKINPVTGRLHTRFQQMVSTGRMSSSAPNLQNIPKKQRFRSCFIAKPGYKLVTADMSGAELRILGNISEDPVFIECYSHGIDLHTRTASEIFGVPMDLVKSQMRGSAKAINFGLCVSEDTKIITDSGVKKIKDVKVGDTVSHDAGVNKVIGHKYMGNKEVFEIKTKYGYTLQATADHLMKVVDEDGDYVDKKLSEIDITKDNMCIKVGSKLFPENNYIFNTFEIDKRTNYKDFVLPTILDNNWAAFLGLFVSEGSILKEKGREFYGRLQFGFSDKDAEFISKIDSLLDTLFGERLNRRHENGAVRYTFSSVVFCEWLSSICDMDTNKTISVHIPECVKFSTKEAQVIFLSWMFEGDGTIKCNRNGTKIEYSSKSYNLIKDVQVILLNFGILTSILHETRKDYPGEIYYTLNIVSNDSRNMFMAEIGFVTSKKCNKYVNTGSNVQSVYNLPNQEKRLLNIKGKTNSTREYNTLYNSLNYTDGVGNEQIKTLFKYDKFFEFISNNNIITLPILSIKSMGSKEVYDISVDQHPYFLADGFIVHNCYGLSKYGLSEKLKISERDAEKMIDTYFERYSGVKAYLDKAAKSAVKKGYSVTVSGRKRFYNIPAYGHPDRKKMQRAVERAAKNAGIQGANADTVKEAMILIVDRLERSGLDAKLLLTVHDEVVVEAREDQCKETSEIVSQALIDGFGRYFSKIPMETDALMGPCWLKGSCENDPNNDGKKCGSCKMEFVEDEKYGTKLVCASCGCPQE